MEISMFDKSRPPFNREKFIQKVNAILQYEINMGLVKRKADFARRYGMKPQALNGILKRGHVRWPFIRQICENYNLTVEYLLFDKGPMQATRPVILPPLVIPPGSTE